MNRTARSLLALGVGFVGATVVFRAAGVESALTTTPAVVGQVDTFDYCRDVYGARSNTMLVGTNAYSWRCTIRTNSFFKVVELDFDDACRRAFGDDVTSDNWDPANPYAWQCVED